MTSITALSGITGLTGSGLTELAKAIFCSPDARRDSDEVRLDGRPLALRNPSEALTAGIVLLTNDRLREGVLPDFTIQENVVLPVLGRFAGLLGLLDMGAIGTAAREAIARLRVRAPGPQTPVRSLSGGNQQKVVLGRALLTEAERLTRAAGLARLSIGVLDGNAEAARTYRAFGFRPYVQLMVKPLD